MYKTSVITDEISQDLPFAARVAREYGLQGLEIRSVNEKNPFQMNADDLRFVKQIADDSGTNLCGIFAFHLAVLLTHPCSASYGTVRWPAAPKTGPSQS